MATDSPLSQSTPSTKDTPQSAVEATPSDLPTMYWGVASGSSIKALRIASRGKTVTDHGHTIDGSSFTAPTHLEISFSTANRNALFEGPRWFIDCGGFTELTKTGEYDSSLESYIDYLVHHVDAGIDIQYWALRDWPVTKALLRNYGRTERTHQRWTVRDHCRSLELAEERGLLSGTGAEPIAVLQGEDTAGYLWMLDNLKENGLLTDHVCLGSLKKMGRHHVEDVAESIREALPARCTLHGLGLTKTHLQYPGIREYFDTADTQAWNKQRPRIPDEVIDVRNTWIGYLYAYERYRRMIRNDSSAESSKVPGSGTKLFEFGRGQRSSSGHATLALNECVCGTLIDPNAILDICDESVSTKNKDQLDALDALGCRHCRNRILNLRMQCIDGIPNHLNAPARE